MSNIEYVLPEDVRQKNLHQFKEEDFPRLIKFIDDSQLLIFTNNGVLLKLNSKINNWCILHEDASFYTYCVMEYKEGLVALGNLKGKVKLFFEDHANYIYSEQIFDSSKIFSLCLINLSSTRYLLACGQDGYMKLCKVDTTEEGKPHLNLTGCFTLPHSKQRWITDAVLFPPNTPDKDLLLVCGDRRGSIHLYKNGTQDPVYSLLGVHGKTGVTSIQCHSGVLFTTGRDGHFRKYRVHDNEIVLVDKQKTVKGLDWIEGIWFDDKDLVVYGFYMQSHFAMWSFEKNEIILKVKCGGGYRSWDVRFPQKDDSTLSFAFLKGPVVNITTSDWSGDGKCRVIKESFHGRETMCAKVLGYISSEDDQNELLIATGSEDTTINFILYGERNNSIRNLHTTVGHIGGVKDLVYVPMSSSKQYKDALFHGTIVSCGSRTSLKIWDFMSCSNHVTETNNQISCSLLTEIFNPEMNPKQLKLRTGDVIDDMRYLCCDVAFLETNDGNNGYKLCVCACSDGVARVYAFNEKEVELLCILGDKKHCVQTARFHTTNSHLIVFTTSTDGTLRGWDLTNTKQSYRLILRKRLDEKDNIKKRLRFNHVNKDRHKFHELDNPVYREKSDICFQIKLHQSGINSIDVIENDQGIHIATGGDDNALCFITLKKEEVERGGIILTVMENKGHAHAHTSSITGVRFLDENRLISSSIDQHLKCWNVDDFVDPFKTMYTDVADVSNLEIWKNKTKYYVIITGFGMEIFCMDAQDFL